MFTLNIRGKLFCIEDPIVMGILNATPDSFYQGDLARGIEGMLEKAELMLGEGARILDIGGQSTRPGSLRISIDEELKRIVPLITALHKRFPEIPLSVDTYQSRVAKEAFEAGAGIINDISAGMLDPEMLETVAKMRVPYVAMHMKGSPENMQEHATYTHLVLEVFDHLKERIFISHKAGIFDIIIDPGFGFAKTIDQNFQLLRSLKNFSILEKPMLVGLSRKATIYKTLNISPAEALNGTTAMHMIALQNGANILRVHDVKPAVEVIQLYQALLSA